MLPSRTFDVIVLGAGAAGMMAAATAGQRQRRVLLVDHNDQPGRKILISGGGRANFTNRSCTAANYLSSNPHFVKSALAQYQPQHFLELVQRYQIRWHEKTLGQLFCDHSARAIVELLQAEGRRGQVEWSLATRILAVERGADGFRIATTQGELQAGALIVATGGLSIAKLGATGLGYELARNFGLRVLPPRPALVPLVLGGTEQSWTSLAGLAVEVEAQAGKICFREKLLVTHRGLSGPAILQASSYWQPGQELVVDFLPSAQKLLAPLLAARARRDTAALRNALRQSLPQRLANFLAEEAEPRGWSNHQIEAAERGLHHWSFHPTGSEGFEKAEVTAGGVDTRDLDSRTLQARAVNGLYFVGEVVDVTGWLGGYNFQWAWSSGVAAGRAV